MHTIADISQQIQKNLAAGTPPLRDTPLDTESAAAEIVGSVIDPAKFSLMSADLNAAEDQVLIEGEADLLGFPKLHVSLGYVNIAGEILFVVKALLPGFEPLELLNKLKSPVSSPTLVWRYGPLIDDRQEADWIPATSHIEFAGRLNLPGLTLPIILRPPLSDNAWELTGDFRLLPLTSLKPLVKWIAGSLQAPQLPPGLDGLEALALSGLSLRFDAGRAEIESAAVSLSTTTPWELLGEKLVVDQVCLSLSYMRDPENNAVNVSAVAAGLLRVGQQAMEVSVGTDSTSGVTFVRMLAEDFRLPDLSDLAGIVGRPDLFKSLPPTLMKTADLFLNAFTLEIDGGNRRLSLLYAALACPQAVEFTQGISLENVAFELSISPDAATPVTARLSALLAVGEEYMPLQGRLAEVLSFSGSMPDLPLSQLASQFFPGLAAILPDAELSEIQAQIDSAGVLDLSARASIDLHDLAGRLEFKLPDGIGAVDLSVLALQADMAAGSWALTVGSNNVHRFPERETNYLQLSEVCVAFSDDGFSCSFMLAGNLQPTAPRDDVLVTIPPLKVQYASQTRQWSVVPVGEGVHIEAFWFDMKDCEVSIHEGVFRLRYAHPLPLVDFGAFGNAQIDRFDCLVTKETVSDETFWGFGVQGRGRLEIGNSLLDTDFDIGLVATPEEKKLVLAVQQPNPIRFSPGPAAGSQPLLELELSAIRLEADSKHKTWSFQSNATGALRDIPEVAKDYFPAMLPEGNFRVDDKGITFDCELPAGMLRPECRLFSVNIEGHEIMPAITVARFGARLGGKDSNVHCILHIELPEALNYLFGGSQDKPKIVFLNPSFDLMLSIGKQVRLALANGTSPFKNLGFRDDHDGQGPYLLANFGAGLNTFRVNVPELNYAGNSWAGSAGMTVLDPPIKIPLTPLKFILRQLKVPQQITEYIPDSVPIDVVDFKKNKTFRSVLEKVLQQSTVAALYGPKSNARTVLEAFDTVWQKIARLIERMPKDFQAYAEPPDIRKLNIRLGATPGGGWSGGLETDGQHALSFMLPMAGFMPPELVGLSLRSLAFGQSAGGLAIFKIDGCIDRFDMVTLAIAIGSITTDAKALLSPGEVEQLANHTELQNVFGIALPAFPIPIPLLYDEISWRYKNWWGVGGQAKGKLQLGPDTTIWTVLESLIPFVFDREYKLQDHPEKGPKLTLQIGPDNLQLPRFLGGGIMGPEAGSPEMPADYSIRFLLDAFKFTNPAYAIQAIPLKHPESGGWIRLGSGEFNFGPLGFKAGWCITTEDEFRNKIVPDKDAQKLLGELDADAVLDNLPAKSGSPYDKGFIALLMGRGGLAGILEFGTNFGMAVTSTGGFETKLTMQGRIADLISLSLYGLVMIRQNGGTTVEGGCSLKFDKTEIIGSTNTITVTDRSFELEAELRLLDAVTLAGDFYIGQDQVYLKGSFSWGYAKGQAPMAALGVFARFNNTGFEIGAGAANLFGTKCAELSLFLDVTRKTPIGARASLDDLTGLNEKLGLSLKTFQAEIDEAAADTKSLMDKAMADLSGNIEGFEDLRKKLPGYLNTLRTATIPKTINARVKSAYTSLSVWQKKAVSEATIRKNVQTYYQKNFAGLIKKLEDALRKVKGADEAAKNAQTRKLLQNTLQVVIDIRKIQYTYKKKVVFKTFSKKITISDPVKPYRVQLEDLKNVIGKLPDSWDKADTAKAAHAAKNRAKQAIDQVVENIAKQIPMIESVQLDLPVAFTAPAVDAHVKMQYAGKTRLLKPVLLDLTNPVKSIDSITEAFAHLLSADAS